MEIIRNQIFNRDDYILAARERHLRLWRQFGQQVSRNPFGKPPTELQAATGLELETILALRLGLYAMAKEWTPSQTVRIPSTFSTHTSKDQVDAFLEMVSGDLSTLAHDVGEVESPWNFLAFQHRPVLREGGSLLVLDEPFLLDRVMAVLYWDVANYIKQKHGNAGFSGWTSVHGEMVELLVEDHLRGLSLSLTTTEEDLRKQSQRET